MWVNRPLKTRLTVAFETPAAVATSSMVGADIVKPVSRIYLRIPDARRTVKSAETIAAIMGLVVNTD
jgi:hypothetical protein